MKKTIVARLDVEKKHRVSFLSHAAIMVEQSNAEAGSLTYRLFEEVGIDGRFIVYEEYVDQQAVDAHNASTHFNTFINKITEMLSSAPVIEVF
ncbi:putative quinol monooxygenase [Aquimarina hainanensis]|uniref:Quinol monooxygenase n=1 Tax=Aquimarina hainanensis TaxID=1578017 RepID=A0ABW5N7R1_9FLAO|nr:putative quinol monooxygenase [Aquimarina sp. TRL1]QKX05727.1 antibiotic biosynthesis monooxygenase [Aquimarina sp. TRL1]